jgi:hypothetical protein
MYRFNYSISVLLLAFYACLMYSPAQPELARPSTDWGLNHE